MGSERNSRSDTRPDIVCLEGNGIRPLHREIRHINLEYHPNDSRIRIADDDICQSLTQRMGTGGG